MISAADFDELFPSMSQPRRHHAPGTELKSPSEACIARWGDDGGQRLRSFPAHQIVQTVHDDYGMPDMVRHGVAFAILPIMAACSASSRTADPDEGWPRFLRGGLWRNPGHARVDWWPSGERSTGAEFEKRG
jgi:hypothetical protein